ncbi:MAG: 3-deoxy-manno-octulosonate cytidylyltransferase [Candidatus Riflebacteria bacterium]|nr:3-deoxy-manno-octulosonate cytidylyltransferase [Candidatus Riflebacteria bacterium]
MKHSYKVIGVVPARMASTRLPRKMLADLHGKPLIVRTAEAAMKSGAFDEVMVATDSQEIVDAVGKAGFKAYLTDPNLPSGTCRIGEVAKLTEADVFADSSVEMATLSFPLRKEDENNPNAVKLVTDAKGDALYFSRSLLPYPRNNEGFAPLKHIGVYGYRKETLLKLIALPACSLEKIESLEQLRALYYGIKIRVLPAAKESTGVDTQADLDRVRKLMKTEN